MKNPLIKSAALLTLIGFAPLHAAEPLAASLPEDSMLFFNAANLTKLRELKDHPLVKTARTGELGKMLTPLMEQLSGDMDAASAAILKEETGLSLEDLMAKFPGGAAGSASLPIAKLMNDPDTEDPDIGITLVADFTGDEALMGKMVTALDRMQDMEEAADKAKAESEAKEAKADAGKDKDAEEDPEEEPEDKKPSADWPGDFEETVTEVAGVKVHEWTVSDPDKKSGPAMSWSVANGKAAISIGKTDLKETVNRLIKPAAEGSLAANPAWKTLPDSAGEADLLVGVNLERALGDMQEALRVQMEKGDLNTGGLPINPLQAWTGAGLDQFRLAFISATFEPEDAALHLGLTYAEKPALLKIYAANGPGTPPLFVPADVQEVSWGTLDWGGFYDNLTALANAVSPMAAGGIEMGSTELKKRIGVDLRKDILGQMGDAIWSTSHTAPVEADPKANGKGTGKPEKGDDDEEEDEPEASSLSALAFAEGQSQVIGIGLHDAKAFGLSLKSIFNTVAPGQALFEDRKFQGTTIHQVKGLPPEMPLAWLIHDETLMLSIGKPDLLEKVLSGMAKPPANPLVNEPHVKAALAKLPEGGVSSGYADAGQLIDVMLGAFRQVIVENVDDDTAEMTAKLPEKLNLPWALVSRLYLGEQSADVRLRLSAKP